MILTQFMQLREKPEKKKKEKNKACNQSVLIFFSVFVRNCINWVHNCEDHYSFDFISALLI